MERPEPIEDILQDVEILAAERSCYSRGDAIDLQPPNSVS
jgi:hypothetical protein